MSPDEHMKDDFVRATLTNDYKRGGWKQQKVFSHSSGGQKSKTGGVLVFPIDL